MSVLEQITLAWQCLGFAFRQLLRPTLWWPWLALGTAQALVLAALWWFAHPWLSWLMAPLLDAVAGPEALRYPNVFRLLPALCARADVLLGATLGALVAGASTSLFAARYAGGDVRPGAAWGLAMSRARPLMLVNLPFNLITLGLSYGLEAWLAGAGVSPELRRMALAASVGSLLVFQSLFLYATAFVVLEGRGWLAALAALPRAASRGMVAALFLTIATFLPLLPVELLIHASGATVERGVPEMVGWIVAGRVGLALASAFLLTGSATLVFQTVIAEPREGGGS